MNPGATVLHQAINLVYDLTENAVQEMADIGMVGPTKLFTHNYNSDCCAQKKQQQNMECPNSFRFVISVNSPL